MIIQLKVFYVCHNITCIINISNHTTTLYEYYYLLNVMIIIKVHHYKINLLQFNWILALVRFNNPMNSNANLIKKHT